MLKARYRRSAVRRRRRKQNGSAIVEYATCLCYVAIIVAGVYNFMGHPVGPTALSPAASGFQAAIQKLFYAPANALNTASATAVGGTAPPALP